MMRMPLKAHPLTQLQMQSMLPDLGVLLLSLNSLLA